MKYLKHLYVCDKADLIKERITFPTYRKVSMAAYKPLTHPMWDGRTTNNGVNQKRYAAAVFYAFTYLNEQAGLKCIKCRC